MVDFQEKRTIFAAWTTRLGGWVSLAMLASLLSFRQLAFGGQMLLGLLAVLALLTTGFERWRSKIPPGTGLTVTVFLAVFIFNAVLSVNPLQSVSSWPFFFWLILSLPIGLAFVDTQPVRRWGIYALMAGTGIGFLSLLLDLWQNPDDWRPGGSLGNINYGAVVSLALPFLLAHLLNLLGRPGDLGGRNGRRLATALIIAVNSCVLGLLLNGTRIGIIAAAVTTAFLAVSYGRRLSLRAVCAILTLVLAAALMFIGRPQTFSRVASLAEFNTFGPTMTTELPAYEPGVGPMAPPQVTEPYSDDPVMSASIHSTRLRLEMWRRALLLIREHPFFGQGFRTIVNAPEAASGFHPRDGGRLSFHNTYLQFAAETGILGLLALLGLFLPGLRLALKRFNDPDPDIGMWSRIAIALPLALGIIAATDNILGIRLALYLYGLLTAWAWTRLSPTTSEPGS